MSGPRSAPTAVTAARSDAQSVPVQLASSASPNVTTVKVAARAAGAIAKHATTVTSNIRVHRIDNRLLAARLIARTRLPCSSV